MTIIWNGFINENPLVIPPWTALSATDNTIGGNNFKLVDDPLGSGRTVGEFTRRSTDTLVSAGYRVELSNVNQAWGENVIRWVYWRTYIPSQQKFTVRPRTILFQLHDQSTGEAAHPPPFECEITSDNFLFLGAYDENVISTAESITTYEIGRHPLILDKWVDFVLHCKFNVADSSGFFRLWIDHREVLHITGIKNCYASASGIDPIYIQQGNYTGATLLHPAISSRTLYHEGSKLGDASSSYNEITGTFPEPNKFIWEQRKMDFRDR